MRGADLPVAHLIELVADSARRMALTVWRSVGAQQLRLRLAFRGDGTEQRDGFGRRERALLGGDGLTGVVPAEVRVQLHDIARRTGQFTVRTTGVVLVAIHLGYLPGSRCWVCRSSASSSGQFANADGGGRCATFRST